MGQNGAFTQRLAPPAVVEPAEGRKGGLAGYGAWDGAFRSTWEKANVFSPC